MKVRIGKIPDTGKDFNVDLESLIESKLIIQAVSGGGKSYAIRKLIEIACGKKQSIIFDREAEFGSLRDKFDFVLAGPDGDIPADIKSAEILARKTLEHGYSLIIDLSEMTKNDKFVYVQRFIEAMLSAKKDLWRDVLVVIDEAHEFAPEGGKGTSPCKEAVVNLASLGRKRGFCGVFGTQRISKLSKDVVAECQNKLIGKTVLDIDRKRAADELGFNTQAKEISLRQLTNGEFYAFGPALSDDVLKIKIDQVVTKHGKEAKRMQKVAKPTAKVREMLARLTDLPAEATKELRDKESMMAEIKSLNQKLKEVEKANKAVPVPKAAVVTSDQIKKIQEQIELSVRREYEKSYREKYKSEMSTIKSKIADILQIRTFGDSAPLVKVPEYKPHVYAPPVVNQAAQKRKEILRSIPAHVEGDLKPIAKMGREILSFMSTSPDRQFKRTQIGAMTGYAHGGGSFSNTITELRKHQVIVGSGDSLQITEAGMEYCRENSLVQASGRAGLEKWLDKLGAATKRIYTFLLENKDSSFTKDEIGSSVGYKDGGGNFNNAISKLNTLGLIKKNSDKTIQINPEIVDL